MQDFARSRVVSFRATGPSIYRKLLKRTIPCTFAIAFMLSPLAGSTLCSSGFSARSFILQGASGNPMVGSHFGTAILLGTLLAICFDADGRLDYSLNTHRCLLRYAFSAAAECCLRLLKPWVHHFCVYDSAYHYLASAEVIAAVVSLGFLVLCGIDRLRLVAGSDIDLTTAKCLCAVMTTCGVFACAIELVPSFKNGLLHRCSTFAAASSFVAAQAWICSRTITITNEAAVQTGDMLSAARWVRWGASASVVSTTSTFVWAMLHLLDFRSPSMLMVFEITLLIDRWSDVALAFACAGLLEPRRNRVMELAHFGEWVRVRRERQILEAMKEAARAISGPSLLLAALFEGADPEELLVSALARFRSVSWDVLKQHPEIIIGGGTLDVVGPGSEHLYSLSVPCKFSECDAFLSHSWRDNANLKWDAISRWCEGFRQQHSRPPTLWLDKVCIEQSNIRQDLQCLPIFLAACNNLVVCCGQSYTRRLWCCVELFVYVTMLAEDETRHLPAVLPLISSDDESKSVKEAWGSFDATECECFVEDDKVRIMGVIDSTPQGLSALNAFIRDWGELIQDCPEKRRHSEMTTSEFEHKVEDYDFTILI